jgi:hypothetical protein
MLMLIMGLFQIIMNIILRPLFMMKKQYVLKKLTMENILGKNFILRLNPIYQCFLIVN